MEPERIRENIYSAYRQLLSNDRYLFSVDANERSITHKLAEYLQTEFTDWNVDCEYNRNGLDPKRLHSLIKEIKSDDINVVTVYPDIIIHHRGTQDNLVVIEAKKSNFSGEDNDTNKLSAYKKELKYKYAFKIIFPTEVDLSANFDLASWIQAV